MGEKRQLILPGRYESVPLIADFVGEAAESAGLGEDAAFHCRMAVDEACTNIIEHAYEGEDKGPIEVTCTIETGHCTIHIMDHGKRFDPQMIPEPTSSQNLDEIQPGGLGLHLMRKMMDVVQFSFENNRNKLTMVKVQQSVIPQREDPISEYHEVQPGLWQITPEGRLDAATAPDFEAALNRLLDKGNIWIVVDMSQVSYIASRGLKTLVSAWRKAGDAGGNLVLSGMTKRVSQVFETVGFSHIFDNYLTGEDAIVAYLGTKR